MYRTAESEWHRIIREGDDYSLRHDRGIVRDGCRVYIRLAGPTVCSIHDSEWDAMDAYTDAAKLVDAILV